MLHTRSKILLTILLLFYFVISSNCCYAQFTPKSNSANIEAKVDSIIPASTQQQLNLKLYNDAYDKYVRKLRFKQRNFLHIKNASLTATQTSLTNWAAGGNNSFVARAAFNMEHIYTAPIFNVKTVLDAAFGMMMTDQIFRKNEDWFNVTITPSWRFAERWEFSSSFLLRSQFSNSYIAPGDTIISSSFMAPGNFSLSAGISYVPPKKKFNIYIAPISGNVLMVINKELADRGGFGMEQGRQFKASFGAIFRMTYKESFAKNKITYETKLESVWDYDSSPTMWWEHKLGFKFTNLLGANLYLLAIYNDKVNTPEAGNHNFFQFQESFGFGLTYSFKTKAPEPIPYNKMTKERPVKKRKR